MIRFTEKVGCDSSTYTTMNKHIHMYDFKPWLSRHLKSLEKTSQQVARLVIYIYLVDLIYNITKHSNFTILIKGYWIAKFKLSILQHNKIEILNLFRHIKTQVTMKIKKKSSISILSSTPSLVYFHRLEQTMPQWYTTIKIIKAPSWASKLNYMKKLLNLKIDYLMPKIIQFSKKTQKLSGYC